ncbi:MAG: ABC transporter ATP-binding protein [Actinomycetota bacterium]
MEVSGLTKFYGKHRGIEDVDFTVHQGEIFGFLGPNGAGKTTTIRTLMDFIRPTRGRAEIFGLDTRSGSLEIHRRVGYLPGELALYEHMRGQDLLRYLAHLRHDVRWDDVISLARRLDADLSRRIRTLSSGNKQKIGLLQAFMHRSDLLILDEPLTGLDPLMQHEVDELISEAAREGRTVFLSSHVLPEVERLCNRVAIIREGRVVAVEEVAALKARALRYLEIHFARPVPPDAFRDLSGVRDVSVRDSVVRFTVAGNLDAVVKTAARFEVVNVVSEEPDLEEVFLTYYGERADAS